MCSVMEWLGAGVDIGNRCDAIFQQTAAHMELENESVCAVAIDCHSLLSA